MDTGSAHNYANPSIAKQCSLPFKPSPRGEVTLASTSCTTQISSLINMDLTIEGRSYKELSMKVMKNLCVDVILGNEFLLMHDSIKFNLGGPLPALNVGFHKDDSTVCALTELNVNPPDLFANIDCNYKPIAAKSRRYSKPDREFIRQEVKQLLKDDIIEPSDSPWRSQVVVTKDDNHRKRLVVDYSETVNKYTQLDAYPMPRIDEFINKLAQYRVFTSIDLKSAYHQVPLKDSDKPFTAFEAEGELWQYKRMPFGVTNGGSCFQRYMNSLIRERGNEDTFAYLDNIYICGNDANHHDKNLADFNAGNVQS